MNFFKKIKERIKLNAFLNELEDDMKNLDEVLLDKRLEVFKEKATPQFQKIGLTNWDGKYKWFSNFNEEGIKHVVEYNVFKYFGGSFSYGNCYQSVPTISGGKRLINHKTDKSTIIHFDHRIPAWQSKMENKDFKGVYKISTINLTKFHNSLDQILDSNLGVFEKWFSQNETIEQNQTSLLKEVENPRFDIGQRIISAPYILSFLEHQKGNQEKADYWIKKHFDKKINSDIEKELLLKKLMLPQL